MNQHGGSLRTVGKERLEEIRERLRVAPPKPAKSITLREAIGQLRNELHVLLNEKNYTYPNVVEYLAEVGINISLLTLKRYLSPSGGQQAGVDGKSAGQHGDSGINGIASTKSAERKPARSDNGSEKGQQRRSGDRARRN